MLRFCWILSGFGVAFKFGFAVLFFGFALCGCVLGVLCGLVYVHTYIHSYIRTYIHTAFRERFSRAQIIACKLDTLLVNANENIKKTMEELMGILCLDEEEGEVY